MAGKLIKQESLGETFETKNVVKTLAGLMDKVTQNKCDPSTVNAACNCASAITEIMKVHVDAEKIRLFKENQR